MRITVQDILEYLAGGMTEDEILQDFSELTACKGKTRTCGALSGLGVVGW
jgi:hypothetical protein